jgi:hypothetical protein
MGMPAVNRPAAQAPQRLTRTRVTSEHLVLIGDFRVRVSFESECNDVVCDLIGITDQAARVSRFFPTPDA